MKEPFYEEEETQEVERPLWYRVLFVVITLIVIAALLAMTILPGLIAASRREEMRHRPTPTLLPSA